MELLQIGCPLHTDPEPSLIWVEIASSFQIPSFQIIGLPAPEVAEARERIRAAIQSSGFEFPRRRVVINLSPAHLRKQGTGLDLAMAISILWSSMTQKKQTPMRWAAWGELGLDGGIRPSGQTTRLIYAGWKERVHALLVPEKDLALAHKRLKLLASLQIFSYPAPELMGVSDLKDAWSKVSAPLKTAPLLSPLLKLPQPIKRPHDLLPLNSSLSRILGVSASGAHHLLLLGPKGSGKTKALDFLAYIQPETSPQTQVTQLLLREITDPYAEPCEKPIRRVGSQIRPSALMGSIHLNGVRPGEYALAHGGLLIADELPEWARDSRESLREPLESGCIRVQRVRKSIEFQAGFVFAGTGNFCPCGGWPKEIPLPDSNEGSLLSRCLCTFQARSRYLARLSGPILDRIDLILFFSTPQNSQSQATPSTQETADRVASTRERLIRRWGAPPGQIPPEYLHELLKDHPSWQNHASMQTAASLRSRHKILRLALTLASWEGLAEPASHHFTEAYCYRSERLGLN